MTIELQIFSTVNKYCCYYYYVLPFSKYVLYARPSAKLFPYAVAKLCNNLQGKYYLHFKDEQTEALRN